MKIPYQVLAMFASVTLAVVLPCQTTKTEPGFVALFDGKSLDGFEQKGGKAKYQAEDGTIVGTCVPSTPNSFLCTKKHYGDFVLEYEFLVHGKLNSGVQIRSHSLKNFRKGRVHGYQVEIDPDVKRNRMWTAGIYDESRRGWLNYLQQIEPARKAFKPEKWNKIRVVAAGDSLKTWINGVAAADLVDSMTLSGFIGLQVHGVGRNKTPMDIRWRNLRIKDLGRHVWKRIFDGKSLAGWTPVGGGNWKVADGALVASNVRSERAHGHLFLDTPKDDFTIRLKFKAIAGNSGLYFRTEKKKGNIGIAGFQAEIDATKDIGGLYETSGRGWVIKPKPNAIKKFFKPGKWNQMTVSAHGSRIVVHVNDKKSAELKNDPGRKAGLIALQLHGGQNVEVHFKDIELLVKEVE